MLYPNPSTNGFIIQFPERFKGVMTVTDLSGKLVDETKIDSESNLQFAAYLKPGVYLIRLQSGENIRVLKSIRL